MIEYDIKIAPLVGCGSNKISRPVKKICEGCGRVIYLSAGVEKRMRRINSRDGYKSVLMCLKCSEPWLKEITMEKGVVISDQAVFDQDIAPVMNRIATDQADMN